VGSLLGVFFSFLTQWSPWLYAFVFLFFAGIGFFAYRSLEDSTRTRPTFVLDEISGIFLTFMAIPLTPISILLGFSLFRLFDVFKPFPVVISKGFPAMAVFSRTISARFLRLGGTFPHF
jgi:phosphatidylglycerophosphatase A